MSNLTDKNEKRTSEEVSACETFEKMKVSSEILKALDIMGITTPTPIQEKTIIPLMNGRDIIAKAPTGTGKTYAFGIPIIECLNTELKDVQAVIICPTRELCIQIAEDLRSLVRFRKDVHIVSLYGGVPIEKQLRSLQKNAHIVVATPGRLLDHLGRRTVSLANVYTAVLDEADEMLKMGFLEDVYKIIKHTPTDTQIAMFSATLSREVMDIAWQYQNNPVEVNIDAEGDSQPKIAQFNMVSSGSRRLEDILKIITELELKRVMIFCNMRSTTQRLFREMHNKGFSVGTLHGDIPQVKRNRIMETFRDGKFDIMVATDVAARGLDIDDIECVINYDIPDENESYLHRIGRTGRAKRKGMSFIFSSPSDDFRLRDIRKYTKSNIIDVSYNGKEQIALKNGTPISQLLAQDDWSIFGE